MENVIRILHCKRCLHKWPTRKLNNPKTCPKCKSPYWDKKRKLKRRNN